MMAEIKHKKVAILEPGDAIEMPVGYDPVTNEIVLIIYRDADSSVTAEHVALDVRPETHPATEFMLVGRRHEDMTTHLTIVTKRATNKGNKPK
jgi:hypothetical protein